MFTIKNIESGYLISVSEKPVWINGIWECGDQRFTDVNGDKYESTGGAIIPPKVSPIQFIMLFTSPERISIRDAVATDAIISDWWNIINDPRLTIVDLSLVSVQGAIDYMTSIDILAAGRKDQILLGIVE